MNKKKYTIGVCSYLGLNIILAFLDFKINNIIQVLIYLYLITIPLNKVFEENKQWIFKNKDEQNIVSQEYSQIIGILERILIFLLLLINQYGAITMVITAKSIARYDAISKSKISSEKFLIGTLYSVIMSILIFIILFKIQDNNFFINIGK